MFTAGIWQPPWRPEQKSSDVLRQPELGRRVALHPEAPLGVEKPVRRRLQVEHRAVAEDPRPVAGVRPALALPPRRVETLRQRILVGPVVVFLGEVTARGAEEEAVRLRGVEIDAAAPQVAVGLIGLGRAEVVVGRRLAGARGF